MSQNVVQTSLFAASALMPGLLPAGRRLELWRRWDRKLPKNPFVERQIARK